VTTAADRQLIEWRDELEAVIRESPIAVDPTDELVALEAALEEAREVAEQLGTSGTRAQVLTLENRRDDLERSGDTREAWLEQHASVLHRYSAVEEELNHRINARVAAYEMSPPGEVLEALGLPGTDVQRRREWTSAVAQYAEARMRAGPDVTVRDPAVLGAAAWRDAVAAYQRADTAELRSHLALRRAI
jgi:hypothetical protein